MPDFLSRPGYALPYQCIITDVLNADSVATGVNLYLPNASNGGLVDATMVFGSDIAFLADERLGRAFAAHVGPFDEAHPVDILITWDTPQTALCVAFLWTNLYQFGVFYNTEIKTPSDGPSQLPGGPDTSWGVFSAGSFGSGDANGNAERFPAYFNTATFHTTGAGTEEAPLPGVPLVYQSLWIRIINPYMSVLFIGRLFVGDYQEWETGWKRGMPRVNSGYAIDNKMSYGSQSQNQLLQTEGGNIWAYARYYQRHITLYFSQATETLAQTLQEMEFFCGSSDTQGNTRGGSNFRPWIYFGTLPYRIIDSNGNEIPGNNSTDYPACFYCRLPVQMDYNFLPGIGGLGFKASASLLNPALDTPGQCYDPITLTCPVEVIGKLNLVGEIY